MSDTENHKAAVYRKRSCLAVAYERRKRMTEEVLVRVTGIQSSPEEAQTVEEPISIVTPGRFYI